MLTPHRTLLPVNRLRNEMDQLFQGVLGSFFEPTRARSSDPALDILETEDGYSVEVTVPGYTLEDLDVSVANDTLTIRGERQGEAESRGGTYLRRERRRTSFQRQVKLPTSIDNEKIEASLENGILTVRLPKSAAAQPRQIEVKVTPPRLETDAETEA
ncbi:MAG: Hsp20/alpha crystallin family protein [Planctomycetota bacterium]